jgi:hypothetical protein
MRVEIRAGELLGEMTKNKGAAGGGKRQLSRGRIERPSDNTPKLTHHSITKDLQFRQAFYWPLQPP